MKRPGRHICLEMPALHMKPRRPYVMHWFGTTDYLCSLCMSWAKSSSPSTSLSSTWAGSVVVRMAQETRISTLCSTLTSITFTYQVQLQRQVQQLLQLQQLLWSLPVPGRWASSAPIPASSLVTSSATATKHSSAVKSEHITSFFYCCKNQDFGKLISDVLETQ